jgi:hypothetical protein
MNAFQRQKSGFHSEVKMIDITHTCTKLSKSRRRILFVYLRSTSQSWRHYFVGLANFQHFQITLSISSSDMGWYALDYYFLNIILFKNILNNIFLFFKNYF